DAVPLVPVRQPHGLKEARRGVEAVGAGERPRPEAAGAVEVEGRHLEALGVEAGGEVAADGRLAARRRRTDAGHTPRPGAGPDAAVGTRPQTLDRVAGQAGPPLPAA